MSGPASHLHHLQLLCQVAGLGWAGWAGLEPACSIRCDSIIVMAAAASRKRIVLRFSEYVVSGAGSVQAPEYLCKPSFALRCENIIKWASHGFGFVDFSHLLKVYYLLQCKIFPRRFYGKIAKNCVQLVEHCRKLR